MRVLHVTTAHRPHDPRIVYKQCPTLTADYEVWCAIPDADPAVAPTVQFIRLPYYESVMRRILITCPLIIWRCWRLRPDVVHFYVPEFIPFAFLFRLRGARLIYEVQENLFKKLHLKTKNRGWLLEKAFSLLDQLARRYCYCIFTEHGYLTTYTNLRKPSAVIYNYASLPLLEPFRKPYLPRKQPPTFFYIGWLSMERAVDTLLAAFSRLKANHIDFFVHLFGRQTFSQKTLEANADYQQVRSQLHFHGYADQRVALHNAAGVIAGLALLKPIGDYPESYTTKLFEYMALGLPVITADFPLYKDVVEHHRCGFCVDPYDADAVARALTYLINNPDEAEEMGKRGRNAVIQQYNWATEATKLLAFYRQVLQVPHPTIALAQV
ncbi:glycosyltransferase [Fibrella forsythiae]|uniref:Glycosyltransferase n=1 Tax=Fibrella forsythiae TaxID=2817061 RepID=A0ABS3JIP1_9BACT|nr:glycosyltransferase [Fibrella forsythiae]MBO0949885.1 glycosyltransferase [Fibrella forsythiae]